MPWTTYLETKSLETVSKQMQPINKKMTYYWHKKLKKDCIIWRLI